MDPLGGPMGPGPQGPPILFPSCFIDTQPGRPGPAWPARTGTVSAVPAACCRAGHFLIKNMFPKKTKNILFLQKEVIRA